LSVSSLSYLLFFFQAEDGIRDFHVTGVQTCALPIWVRGGIELQFDEDQIAFGPLEVVSSDIQRVLEGVHLIMVVLPASAHADVRSEERRVGKECEYREVSHHWKKRIKR